MFEGYLLHSIIIQSIIKIYSNFHTSVYMQVYHRYENVTTGHQDLYDEKQCTVCHNNSNESLLLLCDLCDSASHTYCVGLGDTVPEDDWICRDCTQKKYKHTEDDEDLDADSLSVIDPNSKSQNRLQNHHNVSVADIVREPSFVIWRGLHQTELGHHLLMFVMMEKA